MAMNTHATTEELLDAVCVIPKESRWLVLLELLVYYHAFTQIINPPRFLPFLV
jgi:hypothetical protein